MSEINHPQAAHILQALTDLLELAAKEQVARGTQEARTRAAAARELAQQIQTHRSDQFGDRASGQGATAVGEWRRLLNRALTHAQLPNTIR